jgi:tetratricopeptide (TPR) repeat protein
VGNRPGIENRPGAGNRPGGGNTVINRGDVNVGNRQNNFGGNRVDPGYGVRPPAYNNWRGRYGGYHQGWVNGYWHGYHNGQGWNWGSFALGAAAGVTAWGFGSALYNWGYASYGNPYYYANAAQPIVVEQTVAGGVPQTVTIPALAFDYSQPLDTQAEPPAADVADPAIAKFDAARDAFKSGDYARALSLTDEALKTLPNDATLHEFRALVLFAVGQYEQAASPLYAVLAVGPGWDWTTLAGLYPSVDVYTKQLRALEGYASRKPDSAGARFVLAYHYMTQGHNDAALGQLKQVEKLSPNDSVTAQLIKLLSPPGETPEPAPTSPTAAAVKEGKIAGTWRATPAKQTSINLSVQEDGTFSWRANVNGKAQDISGNWSLAGGILTLAQAGEGSALVGNVTWQNESRFNFRALGAPGNDPGLTFSR